MTTRGRKRIEEEGDLNKKRLRDQAKRAKDTGKRARGAKSRGPAHQGDATGAVVVTQTKKGEELTNRKSLKCLKWTQRNSNDKSKTCGHRRSNQTGEKRGEMQTILRIVQRSRTGEEWPSGMGGDKRASYLRITRVQPATWIASVDARPDPG